MRWVIVRVLPVPAPARMQTGPLTAWAAVRCSSSRPASTASAPVTVSVLGPIGGIPAPLVRTLPPILPAAGDRSGKHPQGAGVLPPSGTSCTTRGRPAPNESGRIPTDVCRCVRRDDVHHHLVRLLRPPQEAHAARGHRLRRGRHRGRRLGGGRRHGRQRRQPDGPYSGVRRRHRPDQPEHRPGQGYSLTVIEVERRVIPGPRPPKGQDRPGAGRDRGHAHVRPLRPGQAVEAPGVNVRSERTGVAGCPDSVVLPVPPDSPPVALVRTARGWSVVCPAGGEPVEGLLEGLTLADVIADELGQQLEPDRSARRSARGPAPTEAEDPRDARIAALERTVAQLEHALAARVSTERAIGVLAEREGLSPREAFEGLRQQARSSGRPVVELAREVLDTLPDAPVAIAPGPERAPAPPGGLARFRDAPPPPAVPAQAPRPRAPLARRAEHPRPRFGAAPGAAG